MEGVPLTVADFMRAARPILSRGISEETLAEVGQLLSRASQVPGFVPEAELRSMHGTESMASGLQSDPDGLTLVLAVFSNKAETPVHNHGSWGIACVVRGLDRYGHWISHFYDA